MGGTSPLDLFNRFALYWAYLSSHPWSDGRLTNNRQRIDSPGISPPRGSHPAALFGCDGTQCRALRSNMLRIFAYSMLYTASTLDFWLDGVLSFRSLSWRNSCGAAALSVPKGTGRLPLLRTVGGKYLQLDYEVFKEHGGKQKMPLLSMAKSEGLAHLEFLTF